MSAFKELPFVFDAEKLDKVIFNILSNAFKFTPEGGFIHINISKRFDKIEISIADNGIGMEPDEKKHAFDLFYRGNKNISLGTGLGLALSQEFVILHEGTIELESEKGKGTTFKIVLPQLNQMQAVKELETAQKQPHILDENDSEIEKISNIRKNSSENSIVIIEDNTDLNSFLYQKFEKNYQVFSETNAEKGWEAILATIPDIIICDVMLPGQDGFSLTQKIKEDFRTSHIPVILLTAKGQIESQIEGTKAGADAYMTKPFNQALLEQKVKSIIENAMRMRQRLSNEVTNLVNVPKAERKFLIEFENLIEKNLLDSTLTVEKLSQEMGMSRVQLFRKITALTNSNVVDYIGEYKLKKAKTLLHNPT